MFTLGNKRRIKANRITDPHSRFEHQFQEEAKRLRTFGVSTRTAADFQRFVQDLQHGLALGAVPLRDCALLDVLARGAAQAEKSADAASKQQPSRIWFFFMME
jgi:hypothetical protein